MIPSVALRWWAAPGSARWWSARGWSRDEEAPWSLRCWRWKGVSCPQHHKKTLHLVHSLNKPQLSWGVLADVLSSRLSWCTLHTRWCRRPCPSAPESRNRHLGRGWSRPFCWRRPWLRPDPTPSCSPPSPPSSVCPKRRLQSPGRCCSGWSARGCWAGWTAVFPPGRWCDKATPRGRGRLCLGQGSLLRQLGESTPNLSSTAVKRTEL